MGSSTNIPDGRSLKERDGELVKNWYIACLSSELKTTPLTVTIYDTHLVLFRDQNNLPVAMPDRCAHRGTLLSAGKIVSGKLMCPYHGWTYDSAGNVVAIPSEGGITTKKICHKTFKTIEQDEVIWVYMGDDVPKDNMPSWRFPKILDKNWTHYFMITDFENEVTNLAENYMDVPHTVYVHAKWFRNVRHIQVPMLVEMKNGRVLCTYKQESDSIGFTSKILNPNNDKMLHTDEYIFPNITRVDYIFGNNGFIINSQITPVSTMNSRVYTYICYKISWWSKPLEFLLKPFMNFYTKKVIMQDVDIMKIQKDGITRGEQPNFISTEADELHLYIERLRELGVKGSPEVFTMERSKERTFWI